MLRCLPTGACEQTIKQGRQFVITKPTIMIWDEDPRFQEGVWRFHKGALLLVTVLFALGSVLDKNVELLLCWLLLLLVFGGISWMVGLVGGLVMKGLFSLGGLWRWLRTHLPSRSKH